MSPNFVKEIDGELFDRMILGGVACLQANSQKVNDLNVFPIPDGDTGENMFLTLRGGFEELSRSTDTTLSGKATAMAKGMLYGARGNSGVILSQLFYGLSLGLAGLEKADLVQFATALKEGVKCAYGAVTHPVEGTILTVAREAVENAFSAITEEMSVEQFFSLYLDEMKKSLEKTPDLLAVLKEAGVIDSGGAGLVYITQGFCNAFSSDEIDKVQFSTRDTAKSVDFSLFTEDSEMQFGYCTELLVRLQNAKTDIANFDAKPVIEFLESIGDSVVAVVTGSVLKIHVHTFTPWKVFEYCQRFGEYLTVKVENMTLQHNETKEEPKEEIIKMPKRARRKYATVTTANGNGIADIFREMGADAVVEGGQTNNPSAEDFVASYEEVNADFIFVLPNNGNIIMSAKQSAEIYKDSKIIVVESKSIGDGYSALSMLDYSSDDPEEIANQMRASMAETVTGMVARSVRTTSLNGVEVRENEYMGFTDHNMLVCTPDKTVTLKSLMDSLAVTEKEYVIVSYGKMVSEQEKEAVREFMSADFSAVELYEIEGQQEVYDFLVIVE